MTLVALSSEPHLGHSEPSDILTVSTFPGHEEGHSNESKFQREFSRNKHGRNSGVDEECNDGNDDDGGDDDDDDDRSEEIPLKVVQTESNFIELSWRGCKLAREAAFLKIKWKLLDQKNVNFSFVFYILFVFYLLIHLKHKRKCMFLLS